jgi:hypothetical protein
MVISIRGPNISDETISGETDALAIVQAHALLSCVLTISVPPDDTIAWMTDTIADTRPSEGLAQQPTQTTGAVESEIDTSQTTVVPNIISSQLPFDSQRDNVSSQTTNGCTLQTLWSHTKPGDVVLANHDDTSYRKAIVVSVDMSCAMANVIYFHDRVDYSGACQMVSFSRLMRWTIAGSIHILSQCDAQEQAGMSPDARFSELEMPVVQTDAYGLSDTDGHKMG